MPKNDFHFSGYATKNDLLCADGRRIMRDAFKGNDGSKVPLVWQHLHNSPDNILGHAILENKADGVYAYCKFNDSPAAKNAQILVEHGDITSMSIYANNLVEKNKIVHQGAIREVSLVLSGANPGAVIDYLNIQHSDGEMVQSDEEAIIFTGESFAFNKEKEEEKKDVKHADSENPDETIGEVFETLTDKQKKVVYAIITNVMNSDMEQSDDKGESFMKKNIFEKDTEEEEKKGATTVLSHGQLQEIFETAQRTGSLRDAVLSHAVTYGIENIDLLFPDAKAVTNAPTFVKRQTEWVNAFMSGSRHTPFSRIKSLSADITLDTARALGYVKGALKKEEFFAIARRITTPTTIYKKQKLDRDDIIDITDLDVVAWLKAEMRLMLDEEVARACLIGDGRDVASEDKIGETYIRPVYKDADFYAHKVLLGSTATTLDLIDAIISCRTDYKGSGQPTLWMAPGVLTTMLLLRDQQDRRLYRSQAELESELRVAKIIEVPVMSGVSRDITTPAPATLDLMAILLNPADYTIGADKGGPIGMFDDFDIDYNQYKYLIETRLSGALVDPKTAVVIEKTQPEA